MMLRLCLLLTALPCLAEEPFTYRRPCMGTVWTIKLYAASEADADKAADAAYTRIEKVNASLSDYYRESDLSRLSTTAGTGKAVPVTGDLKEVLILGQNAAKESGGVFDLTIGPCVQLWRKAKKTRELPTPEAIAAARAATGWEDLVMDPAAGTALLKKPGMLLDAGGIAKGYAQDEAMKLLREKHGITSALIDAGGGVLVSGHPPGRNAWNVAVAKTNPDDPAPVLALENLAVSTSGDLHQTVEIDGVHYSHIIDKNTGLGMTKSVQATVVVTNAALSDWLATTVCLMGADRGIEWVAKKHPEAQVRVVEKTLEGLKIRETPGFERLEVKPVE